MKGAKRLNDIDTNMELNPGLVTKYNKVRFWTRGQKLKHYLRGSF